MKIRARIPREINIQFVFVRVPVRYGEDDMPKSFPGRMGDMWEARINIDTGWIQHWPQGVAHKLHMKVCDQGCYELQDENQRTIASIDRDYVPSWIPGEYGDYIIFDIGPDGVIKNWDKYAIAENIAEWLNEYDFK